ncbi:tetratricopeptide repeat protein [Thalassotalea euphylliae]|uniref:tetratricopeptide repeat protein n=1 Tax=Thalassotalea euphylliae TaxID=1655234 RepID=UPI0036376B6E
MRIFVLSVFLFLSGCSSVPSDTNTTKLILSDAPFVTSNAEVVFEEQVFALTPEQQADFMRFYEKKRSQGKNAHQAVSDFLLAKLNNFSYFGETYTASEAMAHSKGNCMSLAILTTALANLVGVEYGYREVSTLPVFEKHSGLLLSSSHVQTKLFEPISEDAEKFSIFVRDGILIDYFPDSNNIKGQYLKYPQFLAKFYVNKASDALIEKRIDEAFAYARAAYDQAHDSPEVLNILAVIYRRQGEEQEAERIYQHAVSLAPNNISLLSNYLVLLERQGRQAEAGTILTKMAQLDDPNPYSWLDQAYLAKSQGKNRQAITYFKKTIELAPYVKPAYVGLYNIYMEKGQETLAKNTLSRALEWTHGTKERQQLKYKLYGRNAAVEVLESE